MGKKVLQIVKWENKVQKKKEPESRRRWNLKSHTHVYCLIHGSTFRYTQQPHWQQQEKVLCDKICIFIKKMVSALTQTGASHARKPHTKSRYVWSEVKRNRNPMSIKPKWRRQKKKCERVGKLCRKMSSFIEKCRSAFHSSSFTFFILHRARVLQFTLVHNFKCVLHKNVSSLWNETEIQPITHTHTQIWYKFFDIRIIMEVVCFEFDDRGCLRRWWWWCRWWHWLLLIKVYKYNDFDEIKEHFCCVLLVCCFVQIMRLLL